MKNKLYNYILKNKIDLDQDVYEYAILIIKRYFTVLLLTLPISYFLHILIETIIYLVLFSVLRKYIGGFHFNNNWACLIFSVISSVLLPYLAVLVISLNLIVSYILLIIDLFLTKKIAPVDHANKQISKNEILIYKKKAISLEIIYIIIFSITYFYHLNTISNLLVLTMTFNVLSMLMACIGDKQNKR